MLKEVTGLSLRACNGLDGKRLEIGNTFLLEGKRHRVVAKRWGISSLVCLISLLDAFGYSILSFINDVTSSYFEIEPAVTDLQAIADQVGIMTSVLGICMIGRWMTLRQITLLACVLQGCGAFLITIGVVSKIFGLVAGGMFLMGGGAGIMMSVGILVTVNWFPLHERGKATALSSASRILASMFSNIVATRTMGISYSHQQLELITTHRETAENLNHRFKTVFSSIFGFLSLSSMVCCILTIIFVADKPPICESEKRFEGPLTEDTPLIGTSSSYSIITEMKDVVTLFRNGPFAVFFILFSFAFADRAYDATLISSLVLKEFPHSNDQFVGLMYICGIILAAISGPSVGQILDKYSNPRLTIACCTSLLLLAFFASAASFQFHSIAGVFVSYLAVAASRYSLLVCLKHRESGITANQSSSIRLKAYSILTAGAIASLTISTICVRILMDNFSSAFGILFPVPFLVCILLSFRFLWRYQQDAK